MSEVAEDDSAEVRRNTSVVAGKKRQSDSGMEEMTPTPAPAEATPSTSAGDGGAALPEFQAPSSPPLKKQARQASRRSMLNIVRRQSKSMLAGAIPFEDQVAAVCGVGGGEVQDRIRGLLRVSLSATLRGVQDALREEDADDAVVDAAAQVASHIRRKAEEAAASQGEVVNEAAGKVAMLGGSSSTTGSKVNESILLPSRVRSVRGYAKELNVETEGWKKLLADRKEEYKVARAARKAAAAGTRKLDAASQMSSEAREDAATSPEFASAALQRLSGQEARLAQCLGMVEIGFKARRKRLREARAELDEAVGKLAAWSDDLNREISTEAGAGKFAAEAKEWVAQARLGIAEN